MVDYSKVENVFETGIYKITCLSNEKIYVGSACSISPYKKRGGFYGRWFQHIQKLKNNKHCNFYLQNCWNKYGEDSFVFEILELCNASRAKEREEYWIEELKSYDNDIGFNIIKSSLANYGKFTEEHRQKISEALRGKARPKDLNEKLRKPVVQYDLKGNKINEFRSIIEASRETGVQRCDIGQACAGKKLASAGGFVWKRAENPKYPKENVTVPNYESLCTWNEFISKLLEKYGDQTRLIISITEHGLEYSVEILTN